MAPPVITESEGGEGVNRDDKAKTSYTWSAVQSPPSVQTVSAMSLHLYSLEIEKVLRDGSRAFGCAARVELRSRRAGWWCSVPPPRRLLGGQVGPGISPPSTTGIPAPDK